MNAHLINSAEIELTVPEPELGKALLDRVSQLRSQGLSQLIDRVCGEVSDSSHLDRIDTLEIGLGSIPHHRFDEELLARTEVALRAALRDRIKQLRRESRTDQTSIALLECFARTGNLPWWTNRAAPDLIHSHMEATLRATPRDWLALLSGLFGDRTAIARLARHMDGALMRRTFELTRPGVEAFHLLEELLQVADKSGPTEDTEQRWKQRLWSVALSVLASNYDTLPGPFLGNLVPQLARASGVTRSTRFNECVCALASPQLRELLEPDGATRTRHAPAVAERDTTDVLELQAPRVYPGDSKLLLSAKQAVQQHTNANSERGDGPTPHSDPTIGAVVASLSPELNPSTIGRIPQLPHPTRQHVVAVEELGRRRALEELEQLYVDNAGLVILWPFLPRLFERVGLLDERRLFVGEAATMQAIAMLSLLATGDPEPPEFQLPLAKLLCEISPESPSFLEQPLSIEQMEECECLLTATIEHASVLREMTIPEFRQTFLCRTAVLTVQRGSWLLQVEHQPQDLILPHFPWPWQWVKLPWMTSTLQVDW